MLIWYANIPEETRYFLTRKPSRGGRDMVLVVAGFRAVRHFAFAYRLKASASALLCRRLDFVHANARHLIWWVLRRCMGRHSRKPLGFAASSRSRDVSLCLLAHRWKDFALSGRDPRLVIFKFGD